MVANMASLPFYLICTHFHNVLYGVCHLAGLLYAFLPPSNSYVEFLTPQVTHNMTLFGDKVVREIIE